MSHSRGRHKWSLDYSDLRRKNEKGGRGDSLPSPPGYMEHPPKEDESAESTDHTLVTKLGWTLALAPWKQLPLNLFVLWMAGNTISIFPIMMVGMMSVRPVQSLFSYKDVFRKLTGDQAILQKIVWVLANLCGIALGLYKFNAMGLLPTAPSDWLEFMEAKENLEISGGGFVLS